MFCLGEENLKEKENEEEDERERVRSVIPRGFWFVPCCMVKEGLMMMMMYGMQLGKVN